MDELLNNINVGSSVDKIYYKIKYNNEVDENAGGREFSMHGEKI
jgi:hypothetical protein